MQKARETAAHTDLKSVISELVDRLGGHRTSNGAMCRCPAHDDAEPSLSIRVGRTALLFKCFAGCDTDVVIRSLRDIDRRVLNASRDVCTAGDPLAREQALRERARDIWDRARQVGGTRAQLYLRARGLRTISTSLRFLECAPLGSRDNLTFRPALISALHEHGRLVAIQRAFLDAKLNRLASDLGNPRRLLGRPGGGAVMLAPASEVLGLAEGVETALSAAALLGVPVWATLGSERLGHITIPDTVRRLLILPDNDRAGHTGAGRATQAYLHDDRIVETLWPPAGFNDWNDALRAGHDLAPEGRDAS